MHDESIWKVSKNSEKNSKFASWDDVTREFPEITSQLEKHDDFKKFGEDFVYEVSEYKNKFTVFKTPISDYNKWMDKNNFNKPSHVEAGIIPQQPEIDILEGSISDIEVVEKKDLKKVRDLLLRGYQPFGNCWSECYKDGLISLIKVK